MRGILLSTLLLLTACTSAESPTPSSRPGFSGSDPHVTGRSDLPDAGPSAAEAVQTESADDPSIGPSTSSGHGSGQGAGAGDVGPVAGVRSWAHLPSRSERSGVSDGSRDVLMSAAADRRVPSKLLYGIWCAESNRLVEGWHSSWHLVSRQRHYGSACARRYRICFCRSQWAAVQRICEQERDGEPICDSQEVRCSHAVALGPMQHLATRWSSAEGERGTHVVDYDGDGVFDPHSLPDAMASAADHLRLDYDEARARGMTEANAWRHAVGRYRGGDDPSAYVRKVYRYARNWCRIDGYCD